MKKEGAQTGALLFFTERTCELEFDQFDEANLPVFHHFDQVET